MNGEANYHWDQFRWVAGKSRQPFLCSVIIISPNSSIGNLDNSENTLVCGQIHDKATLFLSGSYLTKFEATICLGTSAQASPGKQLSGTSPHRAWSLSRGSLGVLFDKPWELLNANLILSLDNTILGKRQRIEGASKLGLFSYRAIIITSSIPAAQMINLAGLLIFLISHGNCSMLP